MFLGMLADQYGGIAKLLHFVYFVFFSKKKKPTRDYFNKKKIILCAGTLSLKSTICTGWHVNVDIPEMKTVLNR
jgi:hypothetical protein